MTIPLLTVSGPALVFAFALVSSGAAALLAGGVPDGSANVAAKVLSPNETAAVKRTAKMGRSRRWVISE